MKGTILLAVDATKVAARAAELVTDLVSEGHNDVAVLHVHQVATGRWGQLILDHEAEGECVAELTARDLIAAGVRVTAMSAAVPMGHVAAEIARIADRVEADLIVMGTHNESDVSSITLGSTSHRVLHLAHRPILLVPAV